MAFIIGQYNHPQREVSNPTFLEPIIAGEADRRNASGDINTVEGLPSEFEDECVKNLVLEKDTTYFFRCQIERIDSDQVFTVKLVNFDDVGVEDATEQFVKQVVVAKDPDCSDDSEEEVAPKYNKWATIEILFTPVVNFDTILFQLQRTREDWVGINRSPKIAYQQLSKVKDALGLVVNDGSVQNFELLKMGVQSHPGLTMCINHEEIHMSRTGIFELRNGVIPINFFSVVTAANESTTDMENWKTNTSTDVATIMNGDMSPEEKTAALKDIESAVFFSKGKNYVEDAFSLDYMYRKD